jgi:hypothetical protein
MQGAAALEHPHLPPRVKGDQAEMSAFARLVRVCE